MATQELSLLPDLPLETLVLKLPLWQRRYLGLMQSGATPTEAAKQSNVALSTIASWTSPESVKYSPVFARACATVDAGVALLGVEATKQLAASLAPSIVADAYEASKSTPHERDRVSNRSLVLNVAGALSSKEVTVNVDNRSVTFNAFSLWNTAPSDVTGSPATDTPEAS